jgi:myo-inositol 2-dehydrogenase / D-chiro-inositol 1-dehydrogenase
MDELFNFVLGDEMNSQLRVGIIGCGKHMSEVLMPMLRLQPSFAISAVSSMRSVSTEAFAKKWAISQVSRDWRHMLTTVDAIVCSGPVELHEEVTRACTEKGIPLFVEKPIARDMKTLSEIHSRRLDSKSLVQVGYNLRFSEALGTLKKEISARSVDALELSYHANKPEAPLWSLTSLLQSLLLAIAVHPLNTVPFLMGEVTKIFETKKSFSGNKINLKITLGHSGARRSVIDISNAVRKFDLHARAFTGGDLQLEMKNLLSINDASGVNVYQASPLKAVNLASGYFQQFESFAENVKLGVNHRNDDTGESVWMYELFEELLKGDII